ncbi:hypothetical protein BBO99_00006010 [Phytophthora kernoviae]|uniref:Uncharacterized protein n=2 Tax=Phytophthora kernoviae TaxID=325452 RepID=A0A3R7J685_9STRA|nr:hypothetical protein G195_003341 [Phytophthora kernoviae 00238/432]KAG2529310.1 hypothetical protein JM16_001840 [Phytophthora kernoviae]RLN27071.1 hypothetical protein BBI17_002517 [Phytophthora kernoviae]RLN78366.1 hypothetical protein BBO99_00006010 [Phytophthora kernoviae]
MDGAASGGSLDVVQWLHDNRAEGCTISAMNRAAENDHLEVVKWMHAMRNEGCSVSAMEKAAGNGHLEIVKWLHLHRSEGCTERAMDWAAQGGHLDVVKWLHVNRMLGSFVIASALVPQIAKIIKTKSAKDVSDKFQVLYITDVAMLFVYGYGESLWPIYIPATAEFLTRVSMLVAKIYFDR